MSAPKTSFLIHICDGYSFRNMIGIIKTETEVATMLLSPKLIQISFMNKSGCAIHNIVLNTGEMDSYTYNVTNDKGELCPEFPIAFETNDIFNSTKNIGRRDGISMYWLEGDRKINIQPLRTASVGLGKSTALFLNILNVEYRRYDISQNYDAEPNVRVKSKDFADLCSQANALKCAYLEIQGYRNAVTFKGILPNNTVASYNRFESRIMTGVDTKPVEQIDISRICHIDYIPSEADICSASRIKLNILKPEQLTVVQIPISMVKALSKIHNIAPAGNQLKFFFKENMPTKIETTIGIFGTYSVCMKNFSNTGSTKSE